MERSTDLQQSVALDAHLSGSATLGFGEVEAYSDETIADCVKKRLGERLVGYSPSLDKVSKREASMRLCQSLGDT